MQDPEEVPALIHALKMRFLLITFSWCMSIEVEIAKSLGMKDVPTGKRSPFQPSAMLRTDRLLNEFLFSWLVMTERYARKYDKGVVRRARFDETMLWGSGQFLYDLFAAGCIRGPYGLPWDNTEKFREHVLKPAVSLMREYERDETMILPPEVKILLEMRGLTFDFRSDYGRNAHAK